MASPGLVSTRAVRPAPKPGRLRLIVALLPLAAQGAEVANTSVIREDGRFIMHAESIIRAPVATVRKTLTDYEHLPRLNPALKRVEVLERYPGGGVRMAVVSEFCILEICLDFAWVQAVRPRPNGDIAVSIEPNGGDFREGKGRWRLFPEDGGTRLVFDVDLTPNFWVPPALGPWLMRRKLADETFETARGMERMADPGPPRPPEEASSGRPE